MTSLPGWVVRRSIKTHDISLGFIPGIFKRRNKEPTGAFGKTTKKKGAKDPSFQANPQTNHLLSLSQYLPLAVGQLQEHNCRDPLIPRFPSEAAKPAPVK